MDYKIHSFLFIYYLSLHSNQSQFFLIKVVMQSITKCQCFNSIHLPLPCNHTSPDIFSSHNLTFPDVLQQLYHFSKVFSKISYILFYFVYNMLSTANEILFLYVVGPLNLYIYEVIVVGLCFIDAQPSSYS